VRQLVEAITDVVVAAYAHDVLGRLDGTEQSSAHGAFGGWGTVAAQLVPSAP
jgi:hypothetical protein